MIPSTTISFVRHGEVENPRKVYYGRLPDLPLSEHGLAQSQFLVQFFRDENPAVIFSSPSQRARQTAKIIAQSQGDLLLKISELLKPIHTPFQGHPISEIKARNWDVFTGSGSEYEQPLDILLRAQKFVLEVCEHYIREHVIAVTHGDVIAFLILGSQGLPATLENKELLYKNCLLPASIFKFTYKTLIRDETPVLEYAIPYQEDANLRPFIFPNNGL